MNLRTSAGWRRLGIVASVVLLPAFLGVLGLLTFDIERFMRTGWALPLLLICLFVPYSIGYVADMIRRREARHPSIANGDASALKFPRSDGVENHGEAQHAGANARLKSGVVSICVVGAIVIAYGAVRIFLVFAYGASFDWTLFVAMFIVVVLGMIAPSVVGWRRLQQTAVRLQAEDRAWPVFRTDQFSGALHSFRPGAVIPLDLALVVDKSSISVFTTERSPRLLISFPRDGRTSLRRVSARDRLGQTAIQIERDDTDETSSFELIPRRRGIFTYFRSGEPCAEQTIHEIAELH